jgi:hypothetical protein
VSDENDGQDQDQDQDLTDQQVEELTGPAVQVQASPAAKTVAQPPSFRPGQTGPTIIKKLTPRADGMGYDETTRIETKQPYSGIDGSTAALLSGKPAPTQPQAQTQSTDNRIFGDVSKRELSAAKFFEECSQRKECAYWKVEVRRQRPVKWPNNKQGKPLRQGDLGTIMLDTFPALRDRIIEQFGGGRYLLMLKDDQGGTVQERMYLDISTQEYAPRNPEAPVEDETPAEDVQIAKAPAAEEPVKEDRLTELRRKQQEKMAEAELKKVEAQIEKEEKARQGEGSAELSSLREELRKSQEQMSTLLKDISNQSNDTIKALAAKPQDNAVDKLLPLLVAFMTTSATEKKEEAENRRREEERREQQRKEELENRRREAEERRKEEANERRREEERREQLRKEEAENRRREEEHREQQRKEELENRRREDEKADTRRREEIQMLAKLLEKKEDTTTPLMLKAIQESSQTFMQSMAEASKSTKVEIGETAKTQSQFLERIIGVLTETSRADSGKYEKLLDSLIANRLESGSREVENFRKAMELGKAQIREAMQIVEARDQEEEEAPTPAVDPNQSMWSNLSNVILALILSKAGNKDVQQGVATALGQQGAPQLTIGDYQQVAQGMTPLVAQGMGFPQQGAPVQPMMLPQMAVPPQAPINFPPPQPAFIPPPPVMPMPQVVMPTAQEVPAPMPSSPVQIPPPPGSQPDIQVAQSVQPQAQADAQQGPKQLPPPPKLDAVAMQRLRGCVDEMVDMACADIADERREQQWTDYALDYLPKWFLDRMVQMMAINRPDMAINLIRQGSSVERFTRLNALVMDTTKYQIFMQGLMDIISEHRDERVQDGFAMPTPQPIGPAPAPIPEAPPPASAPPASAISANVVPMAMPTGIVPPPPAVPNQ